MTPTQKAQPSPRAPPDVISRRIHKHAPTRLVWFLTLVISGGILVLLTGLTVAAVVMGLVFFSPLILAAIPIWVPIAASLFVAAAATLSLSFCGFLIAVAAALSWLYRYSKGLQPPGSVRVDHARSRIYDTASHMKDYAKEYGGYFQSRVNDAAPGA